MNAIKIYKGSYWSKTITIKRNGQPIDISSWIQITFTMKDGLDDEDDDSTAVIQKVITSYSNPTAGQFILELEQADTLLLEVGKNYISDFKFTYEEGKEDRTSQWQWCVEQPVTNSVYVAP